MPSYKLAKSFLEKLKGKGIDPTYEQFVLFQDYAKQGLNTTDASMALMLSRKIGNKRYYPLTLGASIWYSDRPVAWFADNDEMLSLALLYAMCHSQDLEKLRKIETRRQAVAVLRLWGMGVTMTADDATALMSEMMSHCVDEGVTENTDPDYGIAVRVLQRFYGQTREHWLTEPAEHCDSLIRDAIKANSDPDAPPDPNDPSIKALYHANKLYFEILEAHDGERS